MRTELERRVSRRPSGGWLPEFLRSEWKELEQGLDRAMRDLGDSRGDPNKRSGMGGTTQ